MMKLHMADRTLKETAKSVNLSFKEKIELARLIDRLQADSIELPPIENVRVDSLLIKSIASVVRYADVTVELKPLPGSAAIAAAALREAKYGRLQLSVPLSAVQMEYGYQKKPAAMAALIDTLLEECKVTGLEVEFSAEDATRSDPDFLSQVLQSAIDHGVKTLTLCDNAGKLLPEEMAQFITSIRSRLNGVENVRLALHAADTIRMADACAAAALRCGISELKASALPGNCISLQAISTLLEEKSDLLGCECGVRNAELKRVSEKIRLLCSGGRDAGRVQEDDDADAKLLTAYDGRDAVLSAARQLGYDLSPSDEEHIWQAFQSIIEKKQRILYRELDAIIAAEAMQVPAAYRVESYVINTGNIISAMAHMRLRYHDQICEGISVGDGAIAAAFSAIEQATGRHFELDDFQIQAVTEGREAVGRTLVKLRSDGKLYSGQGISTDIVGAGIMAYINALNKIVFEEEEA